MDPVDVLVLVWIMPSLVTLLLLLRYDLEDHKKQSEYDIGDWFGIVLLSSMYPFIIIALISDRVGPYFKKPLARFHRFMTKEH